MSSRLSGHQGSLSLEKGTAMIPGLGRSREGGHGNPLQYSYQENTMDRGAWWATHERLPEILVVPREKTPTGAAARAGTQEALRLEGVAFGGRGTASPAKGPPV